MRLSLGLAMSLTGSGGGGYSVASLALFARFSTPPSDARKALINALVSSLVASGVWAKLDALYVFAAADSQAALLNWIGDIYNCTATAIPTFTADRGFTSDGVASYVDSNFNPATATTPKYVQDSASFGYWSRTSGAASASEGGWFDATDGTTIDVRSATDTSLFRINQAAVITATGQTSGIGLFVGSRSAAAVNAGYRNGASIITGTTVSTAVNSNNFYFGRSSLAGFAPLQFAAGLIGQNLTAGDHASLYTPMQAYMTAVGA